MLLRRDILSGNRLNTMAYVRAFQNSFSFIIKLTLPVLLIVNPAAAEDRLILSVIVNGQDMGEAFIHLREDGDMLVPSDFFSHLHLKKELFTSLNTSDKISLKSLSHAISFAPDYDNAVLTIKIDPQWYQSQLIRPPPAKPPVRDTVIRPEPFSGFLNYRLEGQYDEKQGFNTFSMPWEIGFNREKWFGLSSFRYRYRDGKNTQTRLMSSLIRDDPPRLNRLTIGDFTPPATVFLSSGILCGISWGTRFSLDRSFKPYPGLNAETVLDTPARAELYSSGNLIREWELLPGPVRFEELNAFTGGDSELLLRDVFGKETRIDLPRLFSGRELLRRGIHEYSYNLGFLREDFGTESWEYGELSGTAFHRYGFTDRFSAGMGAAFHNDLFNAGPMFGFRLGNDHLISSEAMLSHKRGEPGYAFSGQYTYRKGSFAGVLSFLGLSRDFQTPLRSDETGEDSVQSPQTQWNLTASQSWQNRGGLSFSFVSNTYRDQEQTSLVTLSYSKTLFRHFNLSVSMKQGIQGPDEQEFFISVQYSPPDKRFYDNIAYRYRQNEEENRKQELSVQKFAGMGKGFGYSFTASLEGQETGTGGRAVYRHEKGIAEVSLQQISKKNMSGNIGWAGGIAMLGGDIFWGRPITDSFAVAQMEGLDNVPVYFGSSLAGETGRNGSLMIPELISHTENRISVRPRDLPLDYELGAKERIVEMAQRGGVRINFKAFRFTAVEGSLYAVSSEGVRKALSALPIVCKVSGEMRESFTGQDGYFYLENLPPGEYVINVFTAEGVCNAKIAVPENGEIVNNLGDTVCEPEKK